MRLIILNKRTMLIFIAILLALITIIIFTFCSKTQEIFNPDVFYKGTKEENTIAFACNVDWGTEYIPDMLEIFEDNNIKITFFVTGKWAEKNPDTLKEIFNKGHEIGNHGYKHLDYDKLSYERNKEEIKKTHDIIKEITDLDLKYFAPPSGAYNNNTIKASKDLGYDLIMWSIDTIDWREDSTKQIIIKRVTEKAFPSAIVLMHPTDRTVQALPEIIEYLFENGYKIGTISNIMENIN